MVKIIAIAHEKGGVGKTTTSVNLGIGLARQGKKVLLIDADPQGDLTKCLGIPNPQELSKTLSTAMNNIIADINFDPYDVIKQHNEGVDFIPSNSGLAATEITLVNSMSRENVLNEYLKMIKNKYDYILIDCLPSLGLTVINALTACDSIIIPVQAHTLAADDMDSLLKTVGKIKQRLNPSIKIDGIIMTMVDNRTNLSKSTIEDVYNRYGKLIHVFDAKIPFAIRAAEVPKKGQSIFNYDPKGKVAQAYESLTKEVLNIGYRNQRKTKDSNAR